MLTAKGARDIFIVYIHPVPELVWDRNPRQFQIGLCDTIPPPNSPAGQYRVLLNFPGGNRGSSTSTEVGAQLQSGLNEISVGPWIPGLENHLAICATRAFAETQVMYSDNPDRIFRALRWYDGSDRVSLPIACGGNYS